MIVTADDLALQRILNRPKRGIGGKTMDNIVEEARRNNSTMYEVLKANQIFSGKAKKTIEEFVSMIEGWKAIEREGKMPLDELLGKIFEESGVKAMCEADEEKGDERLLNLKALQEDLQNFTTDYPVLSLDEYLQNIALYTDRDSGEVSECVQLMTVHAAKGLEFDTVFVTDLNEGIFPNARSIEDSSHGMEEERRLAYVAFTRAKNHLYVCEAGGFSFIIQGPRQTSRFIKEMDHDYMVEAPGSFNQRGVISSSREARIFKNSFADFMSRKDDEDEIPSPIHVEQPKANKVKFKKGDTVIHPKFGEGIIIKVKREMLEIAFTYPYGLKKIAIFPGLKKKGE